MISNSYVLISYDLGSLNQTQKVKFFYALKGRGKQKGFAASIGAISLARSVILVNAHTLAEVQKFLEVWRCNYKGMYVHLSPEQLGHMYDLRLFS